MEQVGLLFEHSLTGVSNAPSLTPVHLGAQVSLEIPALADMIGRLNASYQTQKSKNVDFLTKAEQVRNAFCKLVDCAS